MSKLLLEIATLAHLISGALSTPLEAAELQLHPRAVHAQVESYCGRCGCLHIEYIYHRNLRATYGLNFDPRNYDQTKPHFYPGRMRAFPRYYVEGEQIPGSCT